MKVPRVLIIAGSDSGGGAGIQADIKTVTMLGGHAMTAITAITAQNTLGVDAVMPIPVELVHQQFWTALKDLGADAIKIGMIGSSELADLIIELLEQAHGAPVVLDPVMVASSGASLADEETKGRFVKLTRLSHVITPNAPELAVLTGMPVSDEVSMREAAIALAKSGRCAVLAKGGHLAGRDVVDLLVGNAGVVARWSSPRIDSRHTHGTGCTLSSAVATGLGRGLDLADAVDGARAYVRAAMAAAPGFGEGHGPMGHWLGVNPFAVIHNKPA